MKLNINLLIVFAFMSFCGFSQDPAAKKAIYKIPASEVKPVNTSAEAKRVTPEKNSVHSCEVDKVKKEATVTTVSSDGSLSKETFELKSEKK